MRKLCFPLLVLLISCNNTAVTEKLVEDVRIPIIIDTDANNELDDQHALAYAFCNADIFNIVGITVNNTRAGDGIEGHYQEALRVAKLCRADSVIPIFKGAEANYGEIKDKLNEVEYDGKDAVDFIIQEAHEYREGKLLLIPIGKLTNIALAISKDPSIIDKVKVIWLGSNYPDPGEYNLENDTSAVNPVLRSGVEFEMVLVAYGRMDGTAALSVPIAEIEERMPGLGPKITMPVEGRNGGLFHNFGDYAINLWQNMDLYGELEERALYDLAALAIVKNPDWSTSEWIESPVLKNALWELDSSQNHRIKLHRNFNKEAILEDFYTSLTAYHLVSGN